MLTASIAYILSAATFISNEVRITKTWKRNTWNLLRNSKLLLQRYFVAYWNICLNFFLFVFQPEHLIFLMKMMNSTWILLNYKFCSFNICMNHILVNKIISIDDNNHFRKFSNQINERLKFERIFQINWNYYFQWTSIDWGDAFEFKVNYQETS